MTMPNPAEQQARRPLRRREQEPDEPAVEQRRQPLGRVEEVERRARRRACRRRSGPSALRSPTASACSWPSFSIAMYSCVPANELDSADVEGVARGSAAAFSGEACASTTSSKVRFMSSIIASSEPPADASIPFTGRGVLSSSVRPSDCASRRAGSIVSTQTVRPCSAARSASAAAVVVLPTPPEPQHTTMRGRRVVEQRVDVEARPAASRAAGECGARVRGTALRAASCVTAAARSGVLAGRRRRGARPARTDAPRSMPSGRAGAARRADGRSRRGSARWSACRRWRSTCAEPVGERASRRGLVDVQAGTLAGTGATAVALEAVRPRAPRRVVGRQQRRPHQVDDDVADRQPGAGQLGDRRRSSPAPASPRARVTRCTRGLRRSASSS